VNDPLAALVEHLTRLDQRLDRLEQGMRETWAATEERLLAIERRLDAMEHGSRESWATAVETLSALEHRIARTAQVTGHETRALDGIELRNVLRSIAIGERDQRRRLHRARDTPDYATAYTEPDPLVSVVIPTHDRPDLLTERSVASVLAQTHANLEVVVVGDAAAPEVPEALGALDDERVRFANLTQRSVVSDEPTKHWLVAGSIARNEGGRLARGRWTLSLDDDDALRPDAIERLLTLARAERAEVAYGRRAVHVADGSVTETGGFPPSREGFAWGAALVHGALRFFEAELLAAEFGEPGDAFALDQMLRAGVRFAMTDALVADYFPSTLHRPRAG
jgi:hypothetical protein